MREPWSLAQPYTVPAGSYFVMGDNRTDSDDSRFWGTVPRADIIGEGFVVYWPVGRWAAL
jgi:signal peptidase I